MTINMEPFIFNNAQQFFNEFTASNKLIINTSNPKYVTVFYRNNILEIYYDNSPNLNSVPKVFIHKDGFITIKFINYLLVHLAMCAIYNEITLDFSFSPTEYAEILKNTIKPVQPSLSYNDYITTEGYVVEEGYPTTKLKFINTLLK